MIADQRVRLLGRLALMAVIAAVGWAIYAWGALNSPVLAPTLAARKAYIAQVIRTHRIDPAAERALAEAYWDRYPDVAKDPYYGRHGALGIEGARAHYERYGKREGRKWGLGK